MRDGWYIAEPDGETWGPYVREDLIAAIQRQRFATGSLAWHVDQGEWLPLTRIALLRGSEATSQARSDSLRASDVRASDASQARADSKRAAVVSPQAAARAKKAAQAAANTAPPPLPGTAGEQDFQRLMQAAASGKLSAEDVARVKRRLADKRRDEQRSAPAPRSAPPPKLPAVDTQSADQAAENSRRMGLVFRRLAARLIDTFSLGMIAATLASLWFWREAGLEAGAANPFDQFGGLWLAVVLLIPIEAILLAVTGTTLGKAIMGIALRDARGDKPAFGTALARSVAVFVRGLALGIPVLSIIAILVAGVQTANAAESPWDSKHQLHVVAGESLDWRLIAFVMIALYLAFSEGWWMEWLLPLVG